MAETPEKEAKGDKQPEAVAQGASGRVTVTVVSLAALAILGAATANSLPSFSLPNFSLPSFDRFSPPNFDRVSVSLPKFDSLSWPNFNRTPAPKSNRVAAPPPKPIPDPIVTAALRDIQLSQRDIQSSQQQNATTLVSLTESSANQQADLKRISRQLMSLTAQVNAMHSGMAPLTTGSIAPSNPRARIIRTSRKMPHSPPLPPPLPRPVGPVSVGGAPLGPAPAAGSGV